MTTASDVFMDTVSLNDDLPHTRSSNNVDHLEAQFGSSQTLSAIAKAKDADIASNPISETEDDDEDDDVVVIVDPRSKTAEVAIPTPPTLPSLRAPTTKIEIHEPVRDYVDPSLFSAEISRHSLDVAHRRAKALEMEVKEMAAMESEPAATASLKLSPTEAVSIIGSAFATSLGRVKKLVNGQAVEYDLLSAGSPSSKMEDLDTDGDGLQLSPDANGNGKHFQTPSVKPALKRISAYSAIESESPSRKPRRGIKWDAEVLAEHADLDDDDDCSGESASLMVNGGGSTPRKQSSRKKPKGMMRRLTPKEKEELYQQRPDLMIVPNWAQKYREELMEAESTRWSFWLVAIITTLVVLLVVLIILIAREKNAAAQHL